MCCQLLYRDDLFTSTIIHSLITTLIFYFHDIDAKYVNYATFNVATILPFKFYVRVSAIFRRADSRYYLVADRR